MPYLQKQINNGGSGQGDEEKRRLVTIFSIVVMIIAKILCEGGF
jgi:hypothetical protein